MSTPNPPRPPNPTVPPTGTRAVLATAPTPVGTAQATLGDILNMKAGDVIPLAVPERVEAKVDGVPVMECSYGKLNGQYALRVEKLLANNGSELVQGEDHG